MPDRERIIDTLQTIFEEEIYPDRPRKFMISLELVEDILALLKWEQQMEMIPLDSLCEWLAQYTAPPTFVRDPDASEVKSRWMSAIREVMENGLLDP